jgi:hypothetical protein
MPQQRVSLHIYSLATADAPALAPDLIPAVTTAPAGPAGQLVPWDGVIGVEGLPTGDGRLIEPNACVWENLPLPLRYVSSDIGAHDGAGVVGLIETITRGQGGELRATGTFDLSSPYGPEAMRGVESGAQDGVSMDLDDVTFEVRVKAELLDPANDPMMAMLLGPDAGAPAPPKPDADGRITVATISSSDELMVTTSARVRAATIVAIPAFDTARIRLSTGSTGSSTVAASGATELAFPPKTPPSPSKAPAGGPAKTSGPGGAGGGMMPDGTTECSCTEGEPGYDPACECGTADADQPANGPSLDGVMPDGSACSTDPNDPAYDPDCAKPAPPTTGPPAKQAPPAGASAATSALAKKKKCDTTTEELTAGAVPETPPLAWFSDPALREVTALRVEENGHVYGHLAAWGTCHISHTANGCVTPPHSNASYAYFHTGSVLTREGSEISVGHITLDTRHAGERLTAASAAAHYENTGHVVADVCVGEDGYGIWVAGALRPRTTPDQVRSLRSAPLSGDWRRVSGNLELVAALAVNVPGFPVPRPRGLVAAGVTQSLVASGMIPPRRVLRPGTIGALSLDDLRYLKRLADRERREDLARQATGSHDAAVLLARRVRASALSMRAHRARAALKES